MGTTNRTMIRIEAEQASWFQQHHGRTFPLGSWVAVEHCDEGARISKLLKATVAQLSLQSTVDQIWIHGFVAGVKTRELLFDDGAWQLDRGEPFLFEDTKALNRWLARKHLTSNDGEAIFNALLGTTFVQAGFVAAQHLRPDVTPEQLEAEAARERAEEEAAAEAERQAQLKDFHASYVLAEPHHPWAAALNPTGVELPAWVRCEATGGEAISLALGCKVLSCRSTHGFTFGLSVRDGFTVIRSIDWFKQSRAEWFSEGEPLPFESPGAAARWMADLAEPNAEQFLADFLGPSARFTARPLTEEAFEALQLEWLLAMRAARLKEQAAKRKKAAAPKKATKPKKQATSRKKVARK